MSLVRCFSMKNKAENVWGYLKMLHREGTATDAHFCAFNVYNATNLFSVLRLSLYGYLYHVVLFTIYDV